MNVIPCPAANEFVAVIKLLVVAVAVTVTVAPPTADKLVTPPDDDVYTLNCVAVKFVLCT